MNNKEPLKKMKQALRILKKNLPIDKTDLHIETFGGYQESPNDIKMMKKLLKGKGNPNKSQTIVASERENEI